MLVNSGYRELQLMVEGESVFAEGRGSRPQTELEKG